MFVCVVFVFFFKQKTAYEMRISDWSSDVCSSDLGMGAVPLWRAKASFERKRAMPAVSPTSFAAVSDPQPGRARRVVARRRTRSEERSVGKECVSTVRSRGAPYH